MAIYLNVVCLVSAMNDFLEARILYDKCTEKNNYSLYQDLKWATPHLVKSLLIIFNILFLCKQHIERSNDLTLKRFMCL